MLTKSPKIVESFAPDIDTHSMMKGHWKDSWKDRPVVSRPLRSRRLRWILAGGAILAALALGLGLGLGLTIGRDTAQDELDLSGTVEWAPLPNTTFTGRAFWQPAVNSTWQIVLQNPIELASNATGTTPDVDVFDIDLFTNSDETIATLHALGKRVICYFDAGSYENYRPDSANFTVADLGDELDGWPGEYWLDINSENVRAIMADRIKIASNRGCDAIDPDNVDGYGNKNGLGLTMTDSIDYMEFLAQHAASYNMSIGLKNAGDIISDVLAITDFSVNESCVEYDECTLYAAYIEAGKPVFHIEYPDGAGDSITAAVLTSTCSDSGNAANSTDFSTVLKDLDLDGWVEYCDGTVDDTPLNTSGVY